MQWFKQKQVFIHQLADIYEATEAEAIFFLICEDLFEIKRFDYMLKKDKALSQAQQEKVVDILHQLKQNKPIQHILGEAHFYGRAFKVNADVLIPRQETELLVERILEDHKDSAISILDIGTGSGCIPISLKAENLQMSVSTMDISEKAIAVAESNAKQHQVDIRFIQQDILNRSLWYQFKDASLDAVVSNPPYVLESEKAVMNKNVVDFDPALALYVDDQEALIFYEAIAEFAQQKLKKGGMLYFEINEQFGKEVSEVCIQNGFLKTEIIKDLQNKDRFVKATL